jgi:hypothetical protein
LKTIDTVMAVGTVVAADNPFEEPSWAVTSLVIGKQVTASSSVARRQAVA